ncbi:MAG: retropepsin-like aspartic protease [Mariprofundaceae bacterium]|nr:retropepsin-like aspartic protease [Mariprofundaceae bacterium]
MHNWLFIVALPVSMMISTMISTTSQADPHRLSADNNYEAIATRAAETGEPLMMMPLSIISRAASDQPLEISYTPSGTGSMIVHGKVNGIPMRFVVDTGASLVSIPSSIAERAGVSTSDSRRVKLHTANGITSAPLVKLDQVIADNIAIEGVMAVVQDLSVPDLGLLGMSFFGQFRMTIDHQRNVITLETK